MGSSGAGGQRIFFSRTSVPLRPSSVLLQSLSQLLLSSSVFSLQFSARFQFGAAHFVSSSPLCTINPMSAPAPAPSPRDPPPPSALSPNPVLASQVQATDGEDPKYTSPTLQKYALERKSTRRFSPNSMWKQALQGLKQEQEGRSRKERQQSINYSKQFLENGTTKKIIEHWKGLSVQQEPTAEERAHSWKVIKDVLANVEALDALERSNRSNVEPFTLGETQLYPALSISPDLNTFLQTALSQREKFLPLCCALSDSRTARLPLRLTALGARGANDHYYLALNISPSKKRHTNSALNDILVEVAFFSSDKKTRITEQTFYLLSSSTESVYERTTSQASLASLSSDGEHERESEYLLGDIAEEELLEGRESDIAPVPTTSSLQSIFSNIDPENSDDHVVQQPKYSLEDKPEEKSSENIEIKDEEVKEEDTQSIHEPSELLLDAGANSDRSPVDIEDTEYTLEEKPLDSSVENVVVVEEEVKEETANTFSIRRPSDLLLESKGNPDQIPIDVQEIDSSDSEKDIQEEEEEVMPLHESDVLVYNQSDQSLSEAAPIEEALQPLNIDVVTSSWCVEGTSLSTRTHHPQTVKISLDLEQVREIGSCDKLFVAACKDETFVINSSMKHTRSQSKCVVENNRAYEWIRGAAMSG
jgi:hypothetical protein